MYYRIKQEVYKLDEVWERDMWCMDNIGTWRLDWYKDTSINPGFVTWVFLYEKHATMFALKFG